MCLICRGEKLDGLERIDCSRCGKLKSLPELPQSLKILYCNFCYNLTCLPNLHEGLVEISCIDCANLTFIPVLPTSLEWLTCCDCENLTSLGTNLPDKLKSLKCKNCAELLVLPELPNSLITLWCKNCIKLKYIPKLPESLEDLWISDCTGITHIPNKILPNLTELWCHRTRIPKLPHCPSATSAKLIFRGCPWIDPDFPNRKDRFMKLIKIQKFVKRFLKRKEHKKFPFLKHHFPRDICGLILDIV